MTQQQEIFIKYNTVPPADCAKYTYTITTFLCRFARY